MCWPTPICATTTCWTRCCRRRSRSRRSPRSSAPSTTPPKMVTGDAGRGAQAPPAHRHGGHHRRPQLGAALSPSRPCASTRAGPSAIDMESATIAAQGYRFRVPYGTLLCVSDKPLHGEIKLPGQANRFYERRHRPSTCRSASHAIDLLRARGRRACTRASCAPSTSRRSARREPGTDRARTRACRGPLPGRAGASWRSGPGRPGRRGRRGSRPPNPRPTRSCARNSRPSPVRS